MKTLVFFLIFLFSFEVYAGAAEDLWKYEPELKNMNIQLTGHKVDQYGNAVNDAVYKRTIDPKVGAARTAQGTVGMGRLLKTSGWGLLGYAALEGLLNAVGWVIDPNAQSIWRNKPNRNDNTSSYNCQYTQVYNGNTYKVNFRDPYGVEHSCPFQAAKQAMKYFEAQNASQVKPESPEFIKWDISNTFVTGPQYFYFDFIYKEGTTNAGAKSAQIKRSVLSVRTDQVVTSPREELTPDTLSDYVNKTHPDYADPELAPKLEPKWNPQLAPDLWTPANKFEETNSPTVQIAKKELDNANPTSPDPEVKPNPDTGGMTLPSFCDWASLVCDFIRDDKVDKDQEEQEPDTSILDKEFDTNFSASASCPPNPKIEFPMVGLVELPFSKICDFFSFLRFGVLTGASLLACWIVSAAVRGGEA